MIPIRQENSINFLQKATDGIGQRWNNVIEIKDNVSDAIGDIGKLCNLVIKCADWVTTILFNPIVVVAAVDKLAIIVIATLLILKILGFENLEKWIWLTFILKIVAVVLM